MKTMTPDDWMEEITNGLEYRETFGFEKCWPDLENDYFNHPNSAAAIGSNLIYSMGDALISSLTVPYPEILVEPRHPMFVDKAPIVESLDNSFIEDLKIRREISRASLFGYLKGRCILKIGYDSEFGWNPALDIGEKGPLGMSFSQFDDKGFRIEYANTAPGMPWVRAVNPVDIVVPWGTVDLESAPWVAHRIIRLNSDIKKDKKYKNTRYLEPDKSMEDFIESYRYFRAEYASKRYARNEYGYRYNQDCKFNELWEIHDRRTNEVIVVCKTHDKFLRKDPSMVLKITGMDFVSTSFVEHPYSFWSTPLSYYLKYIQNNQYDISLQQRKQRRASLLKFIANKDVIGEDEVEKMISGDVGAVAYASGVGDLRNVIVPAPMGSSMDLNLQSNANKSDAREAIGYSNNQLGEFDDTSRRTAREAVIVNQGSGRRESKRTTCITDLYLDTMFKINQLVFNLWTVPRYTMVGRDFVQFTGYELKGHYAYNMSLSNRRMISKAERKMEALMLLPQLMQITPKEQIPQLYKYLVDASADSAFERILSTYKPTGMSGASQQGAPNANL